MERLVCDAPHSVRRGWGTDEDDAPQGSEVLMKMRDGFTRRMRMMQRQRSVSVKVSRRSARFGLQDLPAACEGACALCLSADVHVGLRCTRIRADGGGSAPKNGFWRS